VLTAVQAPRRYGGNPVCSAGGRAVLRVVDEEGRQEHCKELGGYILGRLRALQQKHDIIGDVRGQGLMLGVELVTDRASKVRGWPSRAGWSFAGPGPGPVCCCCCSCSASSQGGSHATCRTAQVTGVSHTACKEQVTTAARTVQHTRSTDGLVRRSGSMPPHRIGVSRVA
jgi:hypothetical protein